MMAPGGPPRPRVFLPFASLLFLTALSLLYLSAYNDSNAVIVVQNNSYFPRPNLNANSDSNSKSPNANTNTNTNIHANININTPKLNIIHLIDFDTYKSVTDRWFLHSARAFAHPSLSSLVSLAELWGPGFEGWTDSLGISENIAARYGAADKFDACMVYFNTDQARERGKLLTAPGSNANMYPKHFNSTWWTQELNRWSTVGKGTVLIDRPHELREKRRVAFYSDTNITLILAPYPSELFAYRRPFAEQAMLVHQPHFVDPEVFHQPIFEPVQSTTPKKRSIDALVAGAIIPTWYPFRKRLSLMIENHEVPSGINARLRPHPGYGDIFEEARKKLLNADTQEEQLKSFSRELGDSKICFVTSSRWGYSVQKYLEAAAAGCLMMGNIPIDRSSLWRQHVIELNNKDSDEKIWSTVRLWISPEMEDERIKKTKEAQKWVLENFSTGRYVEEVVRYVWAVKAGQRGMVLPWEWELEPTGQLEMDG